MDQPHVEIAWRTGGPQGRGVDTAAATFARACALGGLHVLGRREYYSNIMGRHSYYDVRIATKPLSSPRETVDVLTTFEVESLARHARNVVAGGAILFNEADADKPLSSIQFLDPEVKARLTMILEEQNLPPTTAGLLADAEQRGVLTYALPLQEIGDALRRELGISQAVADRMLNTVVVAASCALLDYDARFLEEALVKTFSSRGKIVEMNIRAVEHAYDYVRNHLDRSGFKLRMQPVPDAADQDRLFITGSQAVAMGKLAGGIGFQTYYPISPASDESVYLEAHENFTLRNGDKGSVLVVQTEDELSAVTMAIGASLTGARSATATSGPGFSLMVEGMGWAGINEVPLVVTLYQRGGPSTGLPTRNEQGDLNLAIHAGHGEYPHIVMASSDVEEAFYDAAAALNYAEKYQVVVVHLLDKALASTTQTIAPFDVDAIAIERGEIFNPENENHKAAYEAFASFKRFIATETGVSPRPLLGQPGGRHWLTGAEHTEYGRPTEDPTERERQMEKRARKLDYILATLSAGEKFKVYGDQDAALTLLTWGSNKGAILEGMERLRDEGVKSRLIQIRLLHPFPADEVSELLQSAQPVITVESNYSGQLARLVREQTGRKSDHLVLKYNGRPMTGNEIYRSLKDILAGRAEHRIILRNPFE